jgi:hypothetical protein
MQLVPRVFLPVEEDQLGSLFTYATLDQEYRSARTRPQRCTCVETTSFSFTFSLTSCSQVGSRGGGDLEVKWLESEGLMKLRGRAVAVGKGTILVPEN